jgi:hypothetical protein
MKKIFAIVLAAILFFNGSPFVFGVAPPDTDDYTRLFLARRSVPNEDSDKVALLNRLELFKGTESGLALDSGMTRIEALVTIIRLSGAEREALAQNIKTDFSDIPDWALPYAGYGQAHGLARGVAGARFGANEPITAKQYATMLLRLLGYNDAEGNADSNAFSYDTAVDFAYEAALIDEWARAYYLEKEENGSSFLRKDAAYFMYRALYAPGYKDTSVYKPLIGFLYEEGAIDREKAAGAMLERGETEAEILRALENGYSEVWLEAAMEAIDKNDSIPEDIKEIFKNSLYNWNKEAGSIEGADLFVHNARNLNVRRTPSRQDLLFRTNPEVAAYFSYPNLIVIRQELNSGNWVSSVTHEFRHALSSNVGLTVLEEGITELWSQEVDGGYYAYPYYFVNLAKLIFHIAGAEVANAGDLTGDYEDLFYAFEKESGVDLDNVRLYSLLARISPDIEESILNPDTAFLSALTEVNEVFFSLVKGYYTNNMEARVRESAGSEAFVDRLLALGQLLFYPSAMIREADSDELKDGPSAYYSEEFLAFANETARFYAATVGTDAAAVLRYLEENKDRRFCLEYLGKNAGRMFVKEGTGYRVSYQSGRDLYYRDFGVREDAAGFAAAADATGTELIAGAGFIPKLY